MKLNIENRVRHTPLEGSDCLLPLYEAVANSLHAIDESKQSKGRIDIRVLRDHGNVFNELDCCTEYLKRGLEAEINELDRLIRKWTKAPPLMVTLAEKLEAPKQIKDLEATRSRKRRELFEAQDQIDAKRDEMIKQVEARLKHRQHLGGVATIQWRVV